MTAPHDKRRPDSRPERAPTPPKPFSPKTWPIKVTSLWTTNSLPARPWECFDGIDIAVWRALRRRAQSAEHLATRLGIPEINVRAALESLVSGTRVEVRHQGGESYEYRAIGEPPSRARFAAPPSAKRAPDPGRALTTLTLTPEQHRWLHDHLAGLLADLDPTDDPQIEWARALTDQLSAQLP